MRRPRWIPGLLAAALLGGCAASRPPVATPILVHAPSRHAGLRVLVTTPRLSGEGAHEAQERGQGTALLAAIQGNLSEIGYDVVLDPSVPADFTLRPAIKVERAGGDSDLRARVRLEVVAGERLVDSVEFRNRDDAGWYATFRPFAEHAAVMLVNALVRSRPFHEAAQGVVARRQVEHRVAVLELQGAIEPGVLATLADGVRTAAVVPARRQGYAVMTRAAMIEALDAAGAACVDGDCAVRLARDLGADMVVIGEVRRFDDLVLLALELHDTRTARLVRAASVRARSELALLDALGPAVRDLFDHD